MFFSLDVELVWPHMLDRGVVLWKFMYVQVNSFIVVLWWEVTMLLLNFYPWFFKWNLNILFSFVLSMLMFNYSPSYSDLTLMWKIVIYNTYLRCKTRREFKQFSYWVTSLFARFICLVFLGLCSTDFFRSQFSQSSERSLWKKGKRKSKASKDTCKLFIVNLRTRNGGECGIFLEVHLCYFVSKQVCAWDFIEPVSNLDEESSCQLMSS